MKTRNLFVFIAEGFLPVIKLAPGMNCFCWWHSGGKDPTKAMIIFHATCYFVNPLRERVQGRQKLKCLKSIRLGKRVNINFAVKICRKCGPSSLFDHDLKHESIRVFAI